MDIAGVSSGLSSAQTSSSFQVKVAEGQEDQQEKVVGKVLSSIEGAASSREGFDTGQNVNVAA